MDETNEAASTEPVAVNLADLAALSVANMVAQQVSTPFIDQIAIGSTAQPAGELPNVGGAIADPSAVAPISTDAPSSPAVMSASGSAELPNVSPSPTGTPDASTTSATSVEGEDAPNVGAASAALQSTEPAGGPPGIAATASDTSAADLTQQANLTVHQEPAAPIVAASTAHEAVNALDRFMERISNDFAREGKALVDAMRAEISKLVP